MIEELIKQKIKHKIDLMLKHNHVPIIKYIKYVYIPLSKKTLNLSSFSERTKKKESFLTF